MRKQKIRPGPASSTRFGNDAIRVRFHLARAPMWVCDPLTLAILDVNPAARRAYGFARKEFLSMTLRDLVLPGDAARLSGPGGTKGLAARLSGEWRHRRSKGDVIDADVCAQEILFNGRKAVLLTSRDITGWMRTGDDIRNSDRRFHMDFDGMLEGIQILGPDWRYLYLNASAEKHNRRPNSELLGNRYNDMWPGIETTEVFSVIKRCMEDRVSARMENRFVYPDGAVGWFILSVQAISDGILILSHDITERRESQIHLAQMKRLYATLSQINQTIVRTRSRDELFRSICDVAVEFGEFSLAWVGLLDEASGDVRPAAANGLDVKLWPYPVVNLRRGALKDGLAATAIRTSRIVTSEDIQTDPRVRTLDASVLDAAYHSGAAIPMQLRGKTMGSVNLVSGESGFFRSPDEIRLLEEMGLDISFALEVMESEKEKRETETVMRRWADAFEHCAHGIAIGLPSGHLLTCNPAFARSQGSTIQEISSQPILSMYAPEERPRIAQLIAESDRTGSVRFEADKVRKDGSIYPVQMDLVSVRDEGGNLVYRVATQQEIGERKRAEAGLNEREEQLRLYVEHSPAAIAMFDRDMNYRIVSRRWMEDYRLGSESVIGRSHYDVFPDIPERWKEIHRRCMAGAVEKCDEDPFLRADGRIDWIRWEVRPWRQADGSIGGIIIFSEDITASKIAEEAIRESEERLRSLGDNLPDSYVYQYTYDTNGKPRFLYLSAGVERLHGIKASDVLADADVLHRQLEPRQFALMAAAEADSLKNLSDFEMELRMCRPDGQWRWIHVRSRPRRKSDGKVLWDGVATDITERKRAEEQLVASVQEKEILLQEIHHRVKNNLQVICSLLNLQAGGMRDERIKTVLEESQTRVRAMALVHDKLYRSENLAQINFADYLKTISEDLSRSHGRQGVEMTVQAEAIPLQIDAAVPCGLIVNELVTNALKHGFPHGRRGTVTVTLRHTADRSAELTVHDDGVGLPASFSSKQSSTMGMMLVEALADQISGVLRFESAGGTTCILTFPV